MSQSASPSWDPLGAVLRGATAGLLALRLLAAGRIGFGDSEALYAAYALHPQPAYLDHPGLVGLVARLIGSGTAPSPERAHLVTAVLASLVPWLMAAACRACGASVRAATVAALVFAVVPQIAVGLYALTPDLLLALSWIGAIACAAKALRSPPGSPTATLGLTAAGLLAGTATAAKVSGVLLAVALVVAYLARPARAHARTLAPWAGLAAGAVIVTPIAHFEWRAGWPLLVHRLVDTQGGSGASWRNLGVLLGGQLLYLSPVVVVVLVLGAGRAWAARNDEDPAGPLLWSAFAIPFAVLVALCLWSRAAEPHWPAPAYLALVPALARPGRPLPRGLVVAAGSVAAAMTLAVYAWVLVPSLGRLLPSEIEARDDIANELYGWPKVVSEVERQVASEWTPGSERGDVVVVGPHWVICGQLDAALRGETPVGCDTPIRDDFDGWWPRARWRNADTIVWVTDGRFGPPPDLPEYAMARTTHVRIVRDGRTVRLFTVATLARRSQG
jgi:hypothetical protein